MFTCLLYLTIGPFFAIPRCATVSFTVGIEQLLPQTDQTLALALFSLLFFAAVLFFSLRPGEILTWIGKVLNPLFLCFLAILIIRALSEPLGQIAEIAPSGTYITDAFATGLLEGYNTMDALAGLAFGIIVVNAIRSLGVSEPDEIAKSTVKAGLLSAMLMALIYVLVTMIGAQSRGSFAAAANGGEALAQIAEHYFGSIGALILAFTVTLACLKTAIGLITSCAETFVKLFPHGPGYHIWAIGFCLLSFLIANLGLNAIIACSMPVLMFLYPLAIVLILLTLFGKAFHDDRHVLRWTIGMTVIAAIYDLLRSLPASLLSALSLDQPIHWISDMVPLAAQGFGWIPLSLLGFLLGCAMKKRRLR